LLAPMMPPGNQVIWKGTSRLTDTEFGYY
jgi:hypothetical protein